MYDALYSRQSVEKTDSISIESQLEYCKYETHGNPYKEYIDKGYSGKNTNRPAFEQMLEDVKQGLISRVIVYKLDRISRSILDFANMMDIFTKYNVEFVSSTEKFDTSTPIGRAMLNICIVFAQLERETIQKRVTDAYYSRCKRGFYMGGRMPYGFTKTDTVIDGIKTSMYVPVDEEAEQIKLMFSMYQKPENSLGDIIRYFRDNNIKHLRGGSWSSARISEILKNPVYVKADADIYNFFKSRDVNITNPVSDFTGFNSCYLYKGKENKELVIAPHEGIIPSSDWIKCRIRCLNNKQSTRTCKAKNSWLVGKVKCGRCGHSLSIAKSNTKWHRYFICGMALATKKVKCTGTGGTIYADILEEYILNAIKNRLSEFKTLSKHEKANPNINKNKIRIAEIDKEIDGLLSNVAGANSILMEYINNKITQLDDERKQLQKDSILFTYTENCIVSDHVQKWEEISFEDKQSVVDSLIKVINIADGNIEIIWNI